MSSSLLHNNMHMIPLYSVSEKWTWSLSGKECLACPSETHPHGQWRSCIRCMLGSLSPFGRPRRPNSSYYWGRSMPKTCGASTVCYSASSFKLTLLIFLSLHLFIWCQYLLCVFHFLEHYFLFLLLDNLGWLSFFLSSIHQLQLFHMHFKL